MKKILLIISALCAFIGTSFAVDLEYKNSELEIYVTSGEPTQITFPGEISGGFKRKESPLSIDRKGSDLILFSRDGLDSKGEALIVRLTDGRSYSLRIQPTAEGAVRNDVVRIIDSRESIMNNDPEEDPAYREKKFDYAPPNIVSGLVREMILYSEFGKKNISGYRTSDEYKGEKFLDDGTLQATIDKIFIGPNLWGYVVDVKNLLNQSQKIDPATFRIEGTRAISMDNWELAPKPNLPEQELAGKHSAKIYIVTKAKR